MKVPALLTALVLSVVVPIILCDAQWAWAGESEDLQVVIKNYFEAEITRNEDQVWNLLAPSSIFKKSYSYENYLELVRLNPIRVTSYELKFPPEIKENQDKENLPNVEKIASVVVQVRLLGEGGKETENISVFVFLFENGRWFKG
ncbi:MAG: hypothetical protein NTY51_13700 [Deltaproteobacteria bacterium]|nr:hypothetical protein [Deltaproteobacteria bacterium]